MANCVVMTAANIACPDRSRGHYTYVNHRYPHFNSLGLIDQMAGGGSMLTVDTDINSSRVWTGVGLNVVGNGVSLPFLNGPQTSIPPVYSVVAFLQGAYWPHELRIFEDTIGVFRQFGYGVQKLTYKTADMKYDGNRDHRRYGGILGQLNQFYTLLSKGNFAFDPSGENETYHPDYSGVAMPKGTWDLPSISGAYSTVVPIIGGSITVPGAISGSSSTYFCNSMTISDGYPGKTIVPIWQTLSWKGYKVDIGTRLNWLANNPLLLTRIWTQWNSQYVVSYSNITWRESGSSIIVDFDCSWSVAPRSPAAYYFWNYHCSFRIDRVITYPQPVGSLQNGTTNPLGSLVQLSLRCTVSWTLTDRHVTDPPGFGSPTVGQSGILSWNALGDLMYLGTPARPLAVTPPSVEEIRKSRLRDDFCPLVLERINDIRVASYYSTADAFEGISLGTDANLVEAFAEIDEIVTLLPSIRDAMKELVALRSKPFYRELIARIRTDDNLYDVRFDLWDPWGPLDTIRDVLNWVTGAQLFVAFALNPTIQLLTEVLPEMIRILNKIPTSRQPLVSKYGTLTYDFPDWEFGREKASLVCRTKLTIRTGWGEVLDSLLGIRSLGILPTPGFVWDTLPFSFVLDWFTRIGDRIRTLEIAGMLIPVAIQCLTHSYTVTSQFTAQELEQFRIRARPGTTTPGVMFYKREVSRFIPTPRDSRYDFMAPQFLPNLAIAGSLLYQLLLG